MPVENDFEHRPSPERFHKKLFGWIKLITVEPSMFLYMMAFMITSVVEQSFFFYKACTVDHGFSEEVCADMKRDSPESLQVQITVAQFHNWNGIAGHIFPIILALFMGNWSDRRGRKMPLLLGLFSKLIYSTMVAVAATQKTWKLNSVLYAATIPMTLFGADVAIFAACFAYISDVSSVKQRTLRITILDVAYLSTMPTGVKIGSYLFYNVLNKSYAIMFAINASFLFLAIVYSFVRLEWQTTPQQKPLSGKNVLKDFFDKKHLVETYRCVTKRRFGFERCHIWLIFISMMLYVFQRDENQMMFSYMKLIFKWDVKEYSNFKAFKSTFFVFAMLIGTPLLSKVLKIRDAYIIAIGVFSHVTARFAYFWAETVEVLYIGAGIAALGPIIAPVLRSMTSKLVSDEERGKVFSLLSVFDNAVPIISNVMYTEIYQATLQTMPGAFYWLTIFTQLMLLLLILILQFTSAPTPVHEVPWNEIENEQRLHSETQDENVRI